MQGYRFLAIASACTGALLLGCNDETPSSPAALESAPTSGLPADLVGAPNTWEEVALAPTAKYLTSAASAVNANGRTIMYVFGGATYFEGEPGMSTVEAYNIASNRWAPKASMLGGTGQTNGAATINGKIYVPGGRHYTGDGYFYHKELQIYDPLADTWTFGADMPAPSYAGVSAVIGNRLYVVTGGSGTGATRNLFRYNPAQNRWTRLKASPNYHIEGHAAAINGKLYVAGGHGPGGTTRTLDIYDPATNQWTSGAQLPSVHSAGVGVAVSGQFYVVGGFTDEVVAYNPKTNRWVKKASFPAETARFMSGAKVEHQGKSRIVVHAGLEDSGDNNARRTFVYTP